MQIPEMKSFYDTNGYLVVKSFFSNSDLESVRRRTIELIDRPDSAPKGVSIGREGDTAANKESAEAKNDTIRGMAFLVKFDPVYGALATSEKLLEVVRALIGPRVKVFRDQMLLKPPGGQSKPLHQDQSYFRVDPIDSLVTAWIALDEATAENGCMRYVPGSHRYGIFPIMNDPDRPVHHLPDTGDLELEAPVACPVPAGSVIFHHGCTLHASEANRTRSWRKAVIFHYSGAEARSENEQLNAEVSLEIDR